MKIAAIYVIANKMNHKIYAGSAIDFRVRRNGHISALRHDIHYNRYLQRAWNKYGEDNFTIFHIEKFKNISKNKLRKREGLWIKNLNLTDPRYGYNIQKDPTDNSGKKHPMYGKKRPEHSKNMSGEGNPNWKDGPRIVKCAWCGIEFKRSLGAINWNKKCGYKNYCSKCRYKAHSKKMSGKDNPMYGKPGTRLGKHHSKTTRRKMSLAKSKAIRDSMGRFIKQNEDN